MTYNVFGGTLSLTQSINQSLATTQYLEVLTLVLSTTARLNTALHMYGTYNTANVEMSGRVNVSLGMQHGHESF